MYDIYIPIAEIREVGFFFKNKNKFCTHHVLLDLLNEGNHANNLLFPTQGWVCKVIWFCKNIFRNVYLNYQELSVSGMALWNEQIWKSLLVWS